MDAWYYARNGQQHGPVPREELLALLEQGSVKLTDYVWTQGMPAWERAGRVTDLVGTAAADTQAPAPPAEEMDAVVPVTNFLPWAIAATICCCMPGGVASIVYSAQANSAWKAGHVEEAQNAASKAKLWLLLSVVLGLAGNVLWILFSLVPMLAHLN